MLAASKLIVLDKAALAERLRLIEGPAVLADGELERLAAGVKDPDALDDEEFDAIIDKVLIDDGYYDHGVIDEDVDGGAE